MISGVVWMLNCLSWGSSAMRVSIAPAHEDDRAGSRPAPAAVRRRRPALPEAAGPPHAPRAHRGARGAERRRADPRRYLCRPASERGPTVRLDGVQPLHRRAAARGARRLLRDRRPARDRSGGVRPEAVARPDDAPAPARPRGPARAAVPGAQDPRRRAGPLLARAVLSIRG